MRTTTLALGLVATLAVPASAAFGTPGPYAGTVTQGQTRTHHFDNNPSGSDCIQLAATYTVTVRYAPTSDVLTLDAGGQTDAGQDGVASVTFQQGVCAAFGLDVTGTAVSGTAAYAVTVTRALLDPIS